MSEHKPQTIIQPTDFTPLGQAPTPGPRHKQPRNYAFMLAAALIVAALWFLFSARSLQVTVQAEAPAQVSLSGLVLPLGERYLLRPGDYQVKINAEGYRPLVSEISVDDRDSQTVAFTLQPLPGRLTVISTPPGAQVLVNGEAIGETPLEDIEVNNGPQVVELQHPRYLSQQQDVVITGRAIRQQLDFTLEPAWAEINLDSEPSGASVLLDGELQGQTPMALEALEGSRRLLVQRDGFAPLNRQLQVIAGQPQDLGVLQLQPAAGTLALDSIPSDASVTLNGEFRGNTPLVLNLEPDLEHSLAVFKVGYARHDATVSLGAADSDNRTVELQPLVGEVRVEVSPADAALYVDGKRRGSGSQTLKLTAVEHRVEVRREGYASVSRKVIPRPGLPQRLSIRLKTEQEARMARIPRSITTSLGQTLNLFVPAEMAMTEFSMGASRRESGRRANEILRPVKLQRMFYLQTTEVTNAQFREYEASHNSGLTGGNSLNKDKQPVVKVTWQQAAAFCNWLSRREGLAPFYKEDRGIIVGFNPDSTGFRLPTEAEWAWAARANGETLLKFPWLGKFPPTATVENYADANSAYITGRVLAQYQDGHVVTAPVGSFGPNQNGLYDLGGNVAEWVHDAYAIPEANSPRQIDPMGLQQGDNHVIRGASWTQSRLTELRLSFRDYGQSGRDDVGFRIARYAE